MTVGLPARLRLNGWAPASLAELPKQGSVTDPRGELASSEPSELPEPSEFPEPSALVAAVSEPSVGHAGRPVVGLEAGESAPSELSWLPEP